MSKTTNLVIDTINQQPDSLLIDSHQQFVNQVNESGLPLWMTSMYDNYNHLLLEQEELESRPVENIIMGYPAFVHTEAGARYYKFYHNWDDAYQQYRNDQLNPI